MTTYVHRIETMVPPYACESGVMRDWFTGHETDRALRRRAASLHNNSRIGTRHSVLPDFTQPHAAELYVRDASNRVIPPTTRARAEVFERESCVLAGSVGAALLDNKRGDFRASDVTHLIMVSCTGLFTPGPDHHLVEQLGLRNNVQRYTLGFMGCCAALPALRMAAQFCVADPEAVVMVICVEICTIHFQFGSSDDILRGNALFGDGAAGAIVSARPLGAGSSGYAVRGFETCVIPNSAREMAWCVGDHGFELKLSSYVPDIVGFNVPRLVHALLGDTLAAKRGTLQWAVHPGGPGILEHVQAALELGESHTQASWQVLAENGNMSSATVLFVLRQMLLHEAHAGGATVALAFGPGLTAEAAHFERAHAGRHHCRQQAAHS